MFNTKFILKTGEFIYTGYLDKEKKINLKNKFKDEYGYMRCGCRPEANLFYRISEDCKVYPEHINYVHNENCIRYKNQNGENIRNSGYIINDDTGDVTAYLTFNPKTFSVTEAKDKEEDNIVPPEIQENENIEQALIPKDKETLSENKKKDKNLDLEEFIRAVNIDAYAEKILNNKIIKSKDDFSKYVYGRTHKIHISCMRRNLAELSLEKDGVKFIYLPVKDIDIQNIGTIKKCSIQTIGVDGHIYSNFVNEKTLETALNKFNERYKTTLMDNVFVAGFQYLKKVNKPNKRYSYRILGRIHFFKVSDIGLYCRSNNEQIFFNTIEDIKHIHPDIKYWVPAEDENVVAIISKKNEVKKLMIFFHSSKDIPVYYNSNMYIPVIIDNAEELTYDMLLKQWSADEK